MTKEERVLEGQISIPYQWTAGKTYGAFLAGLKDGKILGFRCSECQKVYVPPSEVCPACFEGLDSLPVDLGQEGVITTFTVVEKDTWPPRPDDETISTAISPTLLSDYPLLWRPDIPYGIVGVKFRGADSVFFHLAAGKDALGKLKTGARVKALWAAKREGTLLDLSGFEVID